ncbi:ATP-binding cassette domain-containing protein [Fusobacterium necrophorum]|uniref:ATP-binding cassette domain-containing protein n=1 Tax=Fusobacterium necrophorum TaxID=859 RepID=UPI002550CF12|nr:ATP-binding cassette domain-containing protein [Fusobacterium necrophorum]MDK4501319.1 ATP-binding cassette domain-containing protein [Fusobacterium necrophorum]
MSLIGENLSFGYSKQNLLFKNVNICINSGDVLGLQGFSGSGKTTLGKVLAGYLETFSGKVKVDGKIYSQRTKGFHPVQIIHQHPEKSINPRWKMKEILQEAEIDQKEIMEIFQIREEWLERWSTELSGGELQRFCIARALDQRTRYIIADEITTMLDGITQAELWKKIINLCKKRNIGLMIISHEQSLLEKLCDKIIDFESLK